MPRAIIAPGEHYHIFNRGINKNNIFLRTADYSRILFYILHFQSNESLSNPHVAVKNFLDSGRFNVSKDKIDEIISGRTVELCAFAIMPNHLHLLVHEIKEGGISFYLQRIENAYTKYFNISRERSGYLFQGPYQSVHVKTNEQLLYLSSYIHKNPIELTGWQNKEHKYLWSSYQDYLEKNRWGNLLKPDIILKQFRTIKEYSNYVKTSGAKEFERADK